MDSKLLLETHKKGIDERIIFNLKRIKTQVEGADRRLKKLVEMMEKNGGEISPGKLEAQLEQFKNARDKLIPKIDDAIKHIENDFTILSKNLAESTTQTEIAEKIKIRVDSFKEPKTPKYLSGIGTALIPSSGGIFATIFLFTSELILASLFLTVILCCGLICFSYSIVLIKKYDNDLIKLHNSYYYEVQNLQNLTKYKKKT